MDQPTSQSPQALPDEDRLHRRDLWMRVVRPALNEATHVIRETVGLDVVMDRYQVTVDVGAQLVNSLSQQDGLGVAVAVEGLLPVQAILWFPQATGQRLVSGMMGRSVHWPLEGLDRSAITELANIVFGAFVTVIADMFHSRWQTTAPRAVNAADVANVLHAVNLKRSALRLEVQWRINDTPCPAVLLVFSSYPLHKSSGGREWSVGRPRRWDQLLDMGLWSPLVLKWAHTWAERFSEPHWAQVVVHTCPFSIASLWRLTPDGEHMQAVSLKGFGSQVPGWTVPLRPATVNLIAQAVSRRAPAFYPDSAVFPMMRAWNHAQKALAIPLMVGSRLVGAFAVGERDRSLWSDALAQLIVDFAPMLATLLEQHQVVAQLRRHAALFDWMNRVVADVWNTPWALTPPLNDLGALPQHMRRWRRQWPQLAGIRGGLWILNLDGVRWRIADAWGPWTLNTRAVYDRWWPRFRAWLSQGDREIAVRGWRTPPHPAVVDQEPVFWYPILERGRTIGGVLLLVPDPVEEAVLTSMLDVVAMAMTALRRQQQLTRQSLRDPLTDAYNRRGLEVALEQYLQSQAGPALFCLVDLDGFKSVNDRFGHTVGDALLVEFTSHARRQLRGQDWVARLGGDEFVWVLVDTAWSDAVGTRLQRILDQSQLAKYGASATMGIVEMPREARTYRDAYRLADARLYRGKHLGRHRLVGPS